MDEQTLQTATKAVQIYAEQHPRPSHVNQAQAAEMIGVSEGTMSKMVRDGTFKLNKVGRIPISQIDAAIAVAG